MINIKMTCAGELMDNKQVWPVMITPFTDSGLVNYNAVRALIEWYERAGVDGLFAVCQSSEMFFLSLEERVQLAAFVKKHAKVPVIASGHISADVDAQIDECRRIADTGVDAMVFVTNRFADENADAGVWKHGLEQVLNGLDPSMPLGLYECPYPFKQLLSDEEIAFCAGTGRFQFLKDTCCDIETIKRRLKILAGTSLKMYNANTATLLDSYRLGAAGFSGVMANFHPELYVMLSKIWQDGEGAELLQSLLTVCSRIESQCYPVNAKYHLSLAGLPMGIHTRTRNSAELTELFKDEVGQMDRLVKWVGCRL